MLIPEPTRVTLENAQNAGVISTPEKNLRTKLESILRSLQSLQSKKQRIEFEIKKQQQSLVRKRQELRRSSSTRSKRLRAVSEAQTQNSEFFEQMSKALQVLDSRLLQESAQELDR